MAKKDRKGNRPNEATEPQTTDTTVTSTESTQGNSAQTKESQMITLTLDTKTRVGSNAVYSIPGHRGLVYFPISIFEKEAPTEIVIEGLILAQPKPKPAAETPDERKARLAAAAEARKAETPAQKAERAQLAAKKAAERADKLAAAAAKLAE